MSAIPPTESPPLSENWCDQLYRINQRESGHVPDEAHPFHCEVLIVGSGYGAAVAAAALGETLGTENPDAKIWVLERGQAYLPGEFPDQLADLPGHVRFDTEERQDTRGLRDGLFDLRIGKDAGILLANGLGGGSLINAGVMAWPQDEVFAQTPWPKEIGLARTKLREMSADMKRRLGAATPQDLDNTVLRQASPPQKYKSMAHMARKIGGLPFLAVPITVAMGEGDVSSDGVRLNQCVGCGDCATGCNHGAKISLDTTLLASAARRGVKLFTGATVMRISPMDAQANGSSMGWNVQVNHTDPKMQWQEGPSFELRARRVVLAAGSLGSTGILMRSASPTFPLSERLGKGFSGNGDLLMAAYRQVKVANAMSDELVAPTSREVGPTITAMIDRRSTKAAPSKTDLQKGYVIQDIAIPGPMRRIFEEITLTTNTVHGLFQGDANPHNRDDSSADPASINAEYMRHTLPLAMIGHDRAEGVLSLTKAAQQSTNQAGPHLESDSAITLSWPELRNDPRFAQQIDELSAWCKSADVGGTVLPNPLWMPLSSGSDGGGKRGPLMIAHPLGGCCMGNDSNAGVVDHLGRVFIPKGTAEQATTYPGLVVLDGSMIASSLGINPSLTIATLSERAIGELIHEWALGERLADCGLSRPRTMLASSSLPLPTSESTCIEITEQMRGWVGDIGIEITLRLNEIPIAHLIKGAPFKRTLKVNADHSRLRVIAKPKKIQHDSWNVNVAPILLAKLSGNLLALHRDPRSSLHRIFRAGTALIRKEGIGNSVKALWKNRKSEAGNLLHSANLAGEVRLIDYDLVIQDVTMQDRYKFGSHPLAGQSIQGSKRITYKPHGNPWKQLSVLSLKSFPGVKLSKDDPRALTLNLAYLVDLGIPLLRITRQRDLASTLMDLASLVLLFARMLLPIHLWNLSPPDQPASRSVVRFPLGFPGLPEPQISTLTTSQARPGFPEACVRLTHYPSENPERHPYPVVMLHGYSASGTSFVHPAVQPGLAQHLWEGGHDVWIVDLRTSAGMTTTATLAWTFEDVALEDIPIALEYIANFSGKGKVNVFAHCMGSAMLWMGLLSPEHQNELRSADAQRALKRLQGQGGEALIHRLCMSQVAPLMHFSEGNLLRSFMLFYARHFIPLGPYRFQSNGDTTPNNQMLDSLMDILLSTMPYPDAESNCFKGQATPWDGTRHRMDALFGRTFNLENISKEVLDHIDDLFGPINLATLSQLLHMARSTTLSSPSGQNIYLTQPKLMASMQTMDKLMSVHGTNNGLSDIKGMYEFEAYVKALGPEYEDKYTALPIEELGHQDCLIGRDAARLVFPLVTAFFIETQQ